MATFDQTKRQTLKTIAGTGAAVVAGPLGLVSAAEAAQPSTISSLPSTHGSAQFDLDLQIVSSSGVMENSLILKNNTDETMHIARFRSDNIVFNNHVVSLSEITADGPIIINPGQTQSFQVSLVQLGDTAPMEYVHADHCTNRVTNDCVDVKLGGFLVDHDVMVITA